MDLVRRSVALAVVAALSVGCSGEEPEPKLAPSTESAASTPSGSAGPSAPASREPEEVVRVWIDGYNEALRTGDISTMSAVSSDDCRQCRQHSQPIAAVHDAGGHFRTDGWTVDKTRLKSQMRDRAAVQVAVTISGGRTVQAAGEPPVVYEQDRRLMLFKLKRLQGDWLISFIGYYS